MTSGRGPFDDTPKPADPHVDEAQATGSQEERSSGWSSGVYLVAFLDIPGQRDALAALRELGRLPDPDVGELNELLRRTNMAVASFRIVFSSLVPNSGEFGGTQ